MADKRLDAQKEIMQRLSGYLPKFTAVFDEETFYITAFAVVILAVMAIILLSRYVKVNDAGHLD